ncbi:sigma-54 dependent transcriptional regulator [Myxococcota bacterium]|nr:sigma-54 dependent transcriptional regulator [Myxococcota bacterium]MBU1429336.1 sigma-54 dependent transcriptional regulator [Myxococcota bacterium]MBU1898949.1 sigma-54 dependent transcriptional regulator [Myxococcota bacterium]
MRQRILVVDDEEEIRFGLTLNLKREGYAVEAVEDGRAALDALALQRCDLILTDLVMPRLDGLGLLKALPAGAPPVIMMSAHADAATAWAAIEAGAVDYLPKPYRVDELRFRVRRALERGALKAKVDQLQEALAPFPEIIARSKAMAAVFKLITKVAQYKTTVLLVGESGTGKELVARALHQSSERRGKPFVAVNCGAIPEALLESELFGHVKGAFTDASRDRRGLFEEAHEGSLFLDEVGELPLSLQVKLLRVLQEQQIRRVGDSAERAVDVRIIAATVRDLRAEVAAGRFREDLYYRLNVLPIALPPLRQRAEDIPLLVEHFIQGFNRKLKLEISGASAGCIKVMMRYAWPGNVRELQNAVERAMILAEGEEMREEDLPSRVLASSDRVQTALASGELSIKKTQRLIEEELIRRALKKTGGHRKQSAELLEISHRALLYKIKDYGIEP